MSNERYANIKYGIYNLTHKYETLESSFIQESTSQSPNCATLECLLNKMSIINNSLSCLAALKKSMDIQFALAEEETNQ